MYSRRRRSVDAWKGYTGAAPRIAALVVATRRSPIRCSSASASWRPPRLVLHRACPRPSPTTTIRATSSRRPLFPGHRFLAYHAGCSPSANHTAYLPLDHEFCQRRDCPGSRTSTWSSGPLPPARHDQSHGMRTPDLPARRRVRLRPVLWGRLDLVRQRRSSDEAFRRFGSRRPSSPARYAPLTRRSGAGLRWNAARVFGVDVTQAQRDPEGLPEPREDVVSGRGRRPQPPLVRLGGGLSAGAVHGPAIRCWSWAGSTGLVRCRSKPASSAFFRSSAWP